MNPRPYSGYFDFNKSFLSGISSSSLSEESELLELYSDKEESSLLLESDSEKDWFFPTLIKIKILTSINLCSFGWGFFGRFFFCNCLILYFKRLISFTSSLRNNKFYLWFRGILFLNRLLLLHQRLWFRVLPLRLINFDLFWLNLGFTMSFLKMLRFSDASMSACSLLS